MTEQYCNESGELLCYHRMNNETSGGWKLLIEKDVETYNSRKVHWS